LPQRTKFTIRTRSDSAEEFVIQHGPDLDGSQIYIRAAKQPAERSDGAFAILLRSGAPLLSGQATAAWSGVRPGHTQLGFVLRIRSLTSDSEPMLLR
jgi:hypothetical protein